MQKPMFKGIIQTTRYLHLDSEDPRTTETGRASHSRQNWELQESGKYRVNPSHMIVSGSYVIREEDTYIPYIIVSRKTLQDLWTKGWIKVLRKTQ